jgi:hypothetical protein
VTRLLKLSLIVFLLLVNGSAVADATTHHRVLVTPQKWRSLDGTYPDASDPTRFLDNAQQETLQCIRFYESHDHISDGDGSDGWYQFTQATWNAAALVLHLPQWTNTWSPNLASGNMQSLVAVWYVKRNGRFGVQWAADALRCPGVFYFH